MNGRVLGEMARHRPVSPCPAPRAQRCMQAGDVHSVLAMRAKARTSARRMPGFACDWSANARPRNRSARLCDPRARTRSACDMNSRLVYATASELARKLGAALGRDWGGAGARHGRTRSQSPLFSAPCTQRCGHRVWCACVCQMLLSRRPNVMAGMQTGDALAAPPQCCGNEGLWGIAHGSPPAPLSRTCGRKLAG